MEKWYWDTSAVVKLYCRESDSESYINYFSQVQGQFLSSQFLEIELFYAFQQKRHQNFFSKNEAEKAFHRFLNHKETGHFELVPLSRSIIEKTRELWITCQEMEPQLTLRSLDGTHLATALDLNCQFLVTADQRMHKISSHLGIKIPEICQN